MQVQNLQQNLGDNKKIYDVAKLAAGKSKLSVPRLLNGRMAVPPLARVSMPSVARNTCLTVFDLLLVN